MLSHIAKLIQGGFVYARSKKTPPQSYQSMIKLYCRTRGRSNDLLHAFVKRFQPPCDLPGCQGILGAMRGEELKEVAEEIQECGFYIFPNLVPADICDALMDFALKEEATLAPPQNDCPPKACYQKDSPLAQGYRFAEQDLVQDHTIQRIATDISLLSLAQTYLQCAPVLSILALWWSTSKPSTDETQRQLAQWFHFDMDRIKWLKFFIHLTDVSSENGPHCFVKHSHRSGQKPRELLRRGYCRIPDEDMERHFPKQSFTEITGPKGTIFAADTRGFHKGKPVIKGDRLIFQIEFCDSLFGGDYWELPYPRHANPAFTAMIEKYPRIYSRFAA